MMNKKEINQVINTIDENINALKTGIDAKQLSSEDKKGIRKELASTIKLALKIKLKSQQHQIENIINALDNNQDVDLIQLQKTTTDLDKVLSLMIRKAA